MRLTRLHLLTLATTAWLGLTAGSAFGAPPVNDNYLSSLRMVEGDAVSREFAHAANTSEATTQDDLFNPSADGIEFGGAGPEDTSCGGVEYGKTVWYDFTPEIHGGVQILATGYDLVVRVYEYDPDTSLITRTVRCQNASDGAVEDVILGRVTRGRYYTVQVGGVGAGAAAAAGDLDFRFLFFGDQDRDDVLDVAPDRCPRQPGIFAAGGCPPEIRPNLRIAFQDAAGGIELTRFLVEQLPRGSRVEVRCRACGVREARTARRRSLTMPRFVDRFVRAGAKLEIFVTHRRTASGRFRHGAIGSYTRFGVEDGGFGRRTVRCLRPGSLVPRRTCT
jgi:hypothetical protein